MVKNTILGVGVTNETKDDILEYILGVVEKKGKKLTIFTPNPEMLVYAHKHKDFITVLNSADLALCDGVGLTLAGKIVAKPFKERVTGVDLMLELCAKVSEKPITTGFLGGGHKIAELTAERLKKRHPTLKIGFIGGNDPGKGAIEAIKKASRELGKPLDILFVAYGFPKQELFISKYINELPVTVIMAVGGSFDYISGAVPRAPKFIRQAGFEWLYRLIHQPWRLKRQLAIVEFLFFLLKELWNKKR